MAGWIHVLTTPDRVTLTVGGETVVIDYYRDRVGPKLRIVAPATVRISRPRRDSGEHHGEGETGTQEAGEGEAVR